MVEDDVIRRVIRLADFLQDHAALALELLRREGAVGQDVADDVSPERQVFLEQLHVIGGLFPGGVGVDVAAHILDRFGDFRRTPALGALEGHVFQKVRSAVLGLRLVAGAGRDIGADGHRLDPVHGFGHDREARGEAGDLDRAHVSHAAFLATKARTRAWIAPSSFGAVE